MSWLSDRTGEVRSGGAGRTWAILIVLVVLALLYPSIVETSSSDGALTEPI